MSGEHESFTERQERLSTGPRLSIIESIFADLEDGAQGRPLRSLSLIVVDSILDADEVALEVALAGLERVFAASFGDLQVATDVEGFRGRIEALIDVTRWGLERVPSLSVLAEIEGDTHSHGFLRHLEDRPGASNTELQIALGIEHESQISRLGARLQQLGLARKHKVGRSNSWRLTPRGVQALQLLESEGAYRPRRPHRQYAAG
jgi:hypothetical protein